MADCYDYMAAGDLMCYEVDEQRAPVDAVMLEDRVLDNLLKTEDRYTIGRPSTESVQTEVTPEMRKIVAEWMLEVCEEQHCEDDVFLLSMNYMNRFLRCCNIRKNQLQLLGTACMLLASKFRQCHPLMVETLVYYTDNSITKDLLYRWELLVLHKLKYDIAAITPVDFLPQLLHRLIIPEICGISLKMVSEHTKTLIALCSREYEFAGQHPSIIACACLASALVGLGYTTKTEHTLDDLLGQLHQITHIEKDYIRQCLVQIEDMIKATYRDQKLKVPDTLPVPSSSVPLPPTVATGTQPKLQHDVAITPTDVHDIRF